MPKLMQPTRSTVKTPTRCHYFIIALDPVHVEVPVSLSKEFTLCSRNTQRRKQASVLRCLCQFDLENTLVCFLAGELKKRGKKGTLVTIKFSHWQLIA